MATNLALDDELILEAQKISGHRTKKAVVTEALQEYIQRRKQLEIVNLARGKGIQGSNTDFLICSVASRHNLSIFTVDQDFEQLGQDICKTPEQFKAWSQNLGT